MPGGHHSESGLVGWGGMGSHRPGAASYCGGYTGNRGVVAGFIPSRRQHCVCRAAIADLTQANSTVGNKQ
jgi:hypothetical protein